MSTIHKDVIRVETRDREDYINVLFFQKIMSGNNDVLKIVLTDNPIEAMFFNSDIDAKAVANLIDFIKKTLKLNTVMLDTITINY